MYMSTGAAGLGPDEAIINSVARFIAAKRSLGRKDDDIRAELEAVLLSPTVSKGHPCEGLNGKNLCNQGHVDAAFITSVLFQPKKPFPMGAILAIGGLLLGAAWLSGD